MQGVKVPEPKPGSPLRMRAFPYTTRIPAHTSHTERQTLVAQSTGIINYSLSKPGLAEPFPPGLLLCIFPTRSRRECTAVMYTRTGAKPRASLERQHSLITRCFGLEGHRATFRAPLFILSILSIFSFCSHLYPSWGTRVTRVTQHTVPTSLFAAHPTTALRN